MECLVNAIPVYYEEYGSGTPVLALHGLYSAHQEIAGFLEPFFINHAGFRRIYPDLPGMGQTPALERVKSSDDMLDTMLGFIERVIGKTPFLVVGHSYGCYIARAIANRKPTQVMGMAVICPLMKMGEDAGEFVVVHSSGELGDIITPEQSEEFRNYFVVQTPETASRFKEAVVPAMGSTDMDAIEHIHENWRLGQSPEAGASFTKPTLILTGRQDSTVGYADQWRLLEHYPHATFAVLDWAGHALPHEQVGLLNTFMVEWLDRVNAHHG